MNTRITMLMTLMLALSGCAGNADDAGPSTSTPDVDETETTDPGDITTPPASDLVASLQSDVVNGAAPLSVTFDLSGGNETDDVAWTLDSEWSNEVTRLADGTALPTTVTHVFEALGSHQITFTISVDGAETTTTTSILVEAITPESPADLVAAIPLSGAFTEDQTDAVNGHPFEVLQGAMAITVLGDWNGGLPESDNYGYPNDLDIYIKTPGGADAAASEMLGFEFLHHEGVLDAGTWTLDVLAYDLATDVTYQFDVIVWYAQPTLESAVGATAADGDIFGDTPYQHTFEVPDHAQAVVTLLTWTTPANATPCNSSNTRTNDLDLSVTFDGNEVIDSAFFHSCEFGFVESGPAGASLGKGGTWTVDVVPFLSPSADYAVSFWYA